MIFNKPLPPPQWPIVGSSPPTQQYLEWLQAADRVLRGLLASPPNVQTANYVLALTDVAGTVEMNLAGANTLTVPLNATVSFAIGAFARIVQVGAGQTTLTAAGGVTIRSRIGLKLAGQWAVAWIEKRAADEWVASGDLTV